MIFLNIFRITKFMDPQSSPGLMDGNDYYFVFMKLSFLFFQFCRFYSIAFYNYGRSYSLSDFKLGHVTIVLLISNLASCFLYNMYSVVSL